MKYLAVLALILGLVSCAAKPVTPPKPVRSKVGEVQICVPKGKTCQWKILVGKPEKITAVIGKPIQGWLFFKGLIKGHEYLMKVKIKNVFIPLNRGGKIYI